MYLNKSEEKMEETRDSRNSEPPLQDCEFLGDKSYVLYIFMFSVAKLVRPIIIVKWMLSISLGSLNLDLLLFPARCMIPVKSSFKWRADQFIFSFSSFLNVFTGIVYKYTYNYKKNIEIVPFSFYISGSMLYTCYSALFFDQFIFKVLPNTKV